MKHIKPQKSFHRNKKILETVVQEDNFENLFEVSSGFYNNLLLYRKAFEYNLEIEFSEDTDLNDLIHQLVEKTIERTNLLAEEVSKIIEELRT